MTRSQAHPVLKYDVLLRADNSTESVEADHVQVGSHWVEFWKGGSRTAIFPAASIGLIKACTTEGNVLG